MEIGGFPVVDVGSTVLLAGVFIAVVTGKLIPAAQRDREVEFWKGFAQGAQEAADRWETAHSKQTERSDRLTAAVERLADRELSSARAVETLQEVAERRKGQET